MKQLAHKWDADFYNDKHSFVYGYGAALVELLNPQYGEHILDLGCGSGELTNDIREYSPNVVGMDSSIDMIEKARQLFPLCNFEIGNASDFTFANQFDAIFSNAVLHWVTDYKGAIKSMYRNLKTGGRIVLEFGGKNNVQQIVDGLRKSLLNKGYIEQAELNLWYFPSIGEYTTELEKAGFTVSLAQWYSRPTELADENNGIKDWLLMFCKPFLKGVIEKDINSILNEVQDSLKDKLFINNKWFADYKRIRIVAHR